MFIDYLESPPVFLHDPTVEYVCACAELDTFSLRSLKIRFQEAGPTSKICDKTDSLRANPAISVTTSNCCNDTCPKTSSVSSR